MAKGRDISSARRLEPLITKPCINPGEYAGRAGEPPRQLDKPLGTCKNKLVTPGKGEELLYCKACRDEAVRTGEIY
jgi:hypothetical protein